MFWNLDGGIPGSTGVTAWPRVSPTQWSPPTCSKGRLAQVGGHLVFAVGSNLGEGASVHLFESHKRLLALVAWLGIDGDTQLVEAGLEPGPLEVWPGTLSGPPIAPLPHFLLSRIWGPNWLGSVERVSAC